MSTTSRERSSNAVGLRRPLHTLAVHKIGSFSVLEYDSCDIMALGCVTNSPQKSSTHTVAITVAIKTLDGVWKQTKQFSATRGRALYVDGELRRYKN